MWLNFLDCLIIFFADKLMVICIFFYFSEPAGSITQPVDPATCVFDVALPYNVLMPSKWNPLLPYLCQKRF